jgi:hypothetical protein
MVIQTTVSCHSGVEIIHHHIAYLAQPLSYLNALELRQVQGDTQLIMVPDVEVTTKVMLSRPIVT